MKRSNVKANVDSEDESLWDVKPRKKAIERPNTKLSKTCKSAKTGRPQSNAQTKTNKTGKHMTANNYEQERKTNGSKKANVCTPCKTPVRIIHEGHCPFCQMPFSLLVLESPRCHTSQCMDLPLNTQKECPDRSQCSNTIASHYRAYLHTSLAMMRASASFPPCEEQCFDYSKQDESLKNEPHESDSILQKDRITESHNQLTVDHAKRKLTFTGNSPVLFNSGNDSMEEICSVNNTQDDIFSNCDTLIPPVIPQCNEKTRLDTPKPDCYEQPLSDKLITSSQSSNDRTSAENVDQSSVCSNRNDEDDKTPGESQVSEVAESADTEIDFSDDEALDEWVSCVSDFDMQKVNVETMKDSLAVPQPSASTSNASSSQSSNTSNKARRTPIKNRIPPRTEGQQSIQSFFQPKGQIKKAATCTPCSTNTETTLTIPKPEVKKQPWSISGTLNSIRSNFMRTGSVSLPKPAATKAPATSSWNNRKCPFYKKIPGTSFTVDAFRYGSIPDCKAYFLTHFHYDHYGGLGKSFSHPLYCSKVTRNLVELKIKVAPRYLHTLPMNTPVMVDGVEVTLLEANHCPGAVLFLFRLADGRLMLHTGDFRASIDMEDYPALKGIHVDTLYLDTTYCDPSHAFPPQQDVMKRGMELAVDFMHRNPNAVIVVGSYTIGKERIFLAIAEAIQSKVCVTREKKGILDCLEDPKVNKLITLNPNQAKVHVLKMGQLKFDDLKAYLRKFNGFYNAVLAIEPTGWTHSKSTPSLQNIRPKMDRDGITIYGLPYSEHSSYTEMKRFTQFIRPDKVLPTVNNGNANARHKMEQLFASWLAETPTSSPKMKQARLNQWCSSK